MKFADNLFQLYLQHFDDQDKDFLEVFIHSVLEQMDHDDLLEVFEACQKDELDEILGNYLNSKLETKITTAPTVESEWQNIH
ncbi:DUF6154 family protein [Sediminibacillus albus]|uniref:Uncharacterized protein n=1 Tax=Sediminibacillus albus TaxID=407036 RepID=A0A1G8Z3C1_9BACI|nr:DUF6154 family protein [Sediminibacillus albus]SDK08835.1 hypothetical protein SAMN05216243_1943 [Sediminibacillus albus]